MLASVIFTALMADDVPPPDLVRKVAARETQAQEAEGNYTYRQSVTVEEINKNGIPGGDYREVRDIIFSPTGQRTEEFVGKPESRLHNLKLTDEDFRDIREVQPFLLTSDLAFMYESHFRGEETVDGIDCYVVQIRPRQILDKQRLFDGMIWVSKQDYSVVRSEGQAVPQILTTKQENLFPHFTTIRRKVDDKYWFPVETYADDTLYFRTGPQRIRLVIRYSEYKRFQADSKITFGK